MRALVPLLGALVLAPAAQAAEVYEWTAETRSFSYNKSVCGEGVDENVYTEEVTQEILHRASGVSHVGNGRSLPRGSSTSSGRIRRVLSKKVQNSEGTQYQDGTVTENLPMLAANWGAVNRVGKKGRRRIDVTGLDGGASFSGLKKKGQTITIRIDQAAPPVNEDDGRCVVTGHGKLTGTVTITRVR